MCASSVHPLTLNVGFGRSGTVVFKVIQDGGVPGETQQHLRTRRLKACLPNTLIITGEEESCCSFPLFCLRDGRWPWISWLQSKQRAWSLRVAPLLSQPHFCVFSRADFILSKTLQINYTRQGSQWKKKTKKQLPIIALRMTFQCSRWLKKTGWSTVKVFVRCLQEIFAFAGYFSRGKVFGISAPLWKTITQLCVKQKAFSDSHNVTQWSYVLPCHFHLTHGESTFTPQPADFSLPTKFDIGQYWPLVPGFVLTAGYRGPWLVTTDRVLIPQAK